MRPQLLLLGSALLVSVSACKRSDTDSRGQTSGQRPSSEASSLSVPPLPQASANAAGAPARLPIAATAGAGNPSDSTLVHCKALGKRNQVSIGTLREAVVSLIPEGDGVFAFTYHQALARVTLTRFRRDGSSSEVIGRHTSLGEPKSPLLTADAAYFLRNKSLIRMSRATGECTEVAKGFAGSIAVQGEFVYGFACEAKKPPDHLIRVSGKGGSVEQVATIERVKESEQDGSGAVCDYQSTIADAMAVYAANWNRRQILRVSLADGSLTPLATKKAFPSNLAFDAEDILFQAAGGLYRVPKAEPNVTRISELGSAPFTFVAHAGPTTYIHQSEPYAPEEWTYELVRATSKPKKLELYRALDPEQTPPDTGIRALAVDDECLYTVRQLKGGDIVLYAKSRV